MGGFVPLFATADGMHAISYLEAENVHIYVYCTLLYQWFATAILFFADLFCYLLYVISTVDSISTQNNLFI